MISDNTIQEVRDAVDILDVISSRIKVERAGIHHKACCPFHAEKSPSLVIYTKSNSYYCFGCQQSGDAIRFVQKFDGVDFITAVKQLASLYSIDIVETIQEKDSTHDIKTSLRTVLMLAQQSYTEGGEQNLGKLYFGERGFDTETLVHFGIGYCSGAEKIEGDTVAAGLTNEKGNHKMYKRVTIPIRDQNGNIVAYAGRVIDPEQKPKYLNFGETILYSKNELLYHLSDARPSIHQLNEVWLVEGYADVMGMWQAGFKNVIAVGGTALTDGQVELLRRTIGKRRVRIYVAFDNDEAGKKATRAAIPKLLAVGEVKLINIENVKDLGELAIKFPKSVAALRLSSVDAIETFTEEAMAKAEGAYAVSNVQDEIAKLVARVESAGARAIYCKEISSKIGLKVNEFTDKVDKIRNPNSTKKKEELAEAEYVKVGDSYLQKILDFDPTTNIYTTRYKQRQRSELVLENSKAFIRAIPRFDDWCTLPAHVDYSRIIEHKHNGLINRKLNEYQPLPFQPLPFELPKGWNIDGFDYEAIPEIRYTAAFFKHIANYKKYKNRYLQLLWDYYAIMYLYPLQNLQALCLVSTEEGTGKSTLISYLVSVFGQNATTITPDRITANFNSTMSGKLFVAVEETSDQRAALENQLKDLITGREIIVERKFQESRKEVNFLKFIFASNHPEQFLKVGSATTRFAVLHVPQVETKTTDILEKMIAEIPFTLHFLRERGVITPKTDRLWFDPMLWENDALLRLRQASKDVVVQNLELLIENIYIKTGYPQPYLRLSSEYIKQLMVMFAGESFKNKSPNYFSDTLRNKMGCKQSETPRSYSYPNMTHLVFTERWEYSVEKNKARYIEIPIFKFVRPATIAENLDSTELADFIKSYEDLLPQLEKDWGQDAEVWLSGLKEILALSTQIIDDEPDWVAGL